MKQEDLLKKWLADDLTEAEKKAFEASDDFPLANAIVNDAVHFKASQFTKAASFKVLKNKLHATTKNEARPVKTLFPLKALSRIAAVLIVAVGLYFMWNANTIENFETEIAEKETITLPDNSLVTLNAVSQLSFNENNWDKNRNLKLEGEAYFNVEKGSKFKVETSKGIVEVLGTQFNVKQRGDYFEVICYEGLVQVTHNNTVKKLPAGNSYIFVNSKVENLTTTADSPVWLKNMSSFTNISIAEVLNELERQYDIKIDKKRINGDLQFTGSFPHDDVRKALTSIAAPMGLNFKITNKNVTIYEKKQP